MSGIVSWIAGKIKWLLLIAALGGPVVAFMSWQDGQRVRKIAKDGVEAVASVESATRTKRRRGGTSYAIDLAWKDAGGASRTAEKISISQDYARRIIVGDTIRVATVPIKYLPDEPGKDAVIIQEDAAKQVSTDDEMVYVGAGAGAIGLIGSGLFFLLGRRRSENEEQTA
ncbi:DUF3592 domain-containing protein [Bosea sp. TWI1241]|jgi:hypothetical protein|uniref:DUF3592 domain-containing protein n=1 Tax=Bosea sp. TWI1241 TaxID=3148904 RepID=UPI00320972E1